MSLGRRGVVVVALVAAAGGLLAVTAGSGDPVARPAGPPAAAADTLPPPPAQPCTVGRPGGEVLLTSEQAMALTEAAAASLRGRRPSHYDGRAVDVFFRPVGDEGQRRAGWVLAQWLVAHAQRYDVLSVIHADHIWTSWASGAGWRDYVHPSGNRTNKVLRHLDHVHVAVESGRPWWRD